MPGALRPLLFACLTVAFSPATGSFHPCRRPQARWMVNRCACLCIQRRPPRANPAAHSERPSPHLRSAFHFWGGPRHGEGDTFATIVLHSILTLRESPSLEYTWVAAATAQELAVPSRFSLCKAFSGPCSLVIGLASPRRWRPVRGARCLEEVRLSLEGGAL